MPDVYQLQTTTDSRESAETIARVLVEKRVAACAQVVGPIQSIYRWQGNVENEQEWLVLVKTDHPDEAKDAIVEVHSYDVPEVLSFRVETGHRPYLDWVAQETTTQA